MRGPPVHQSQDWERLIPKATGKRLFYKRNASLRDTMGKLPEVIRATAHQMKLVAPYLKRASLEQTCRAIWEELFQRYRYRRDPEGLELIRTPQMAFATRFEGIDCDCFTVTISAILLNLGIAHRLRVVRYRGDSMFSHIYVVVGNGAGYYVIDPVMNRFNFEEPFVEKTEINMDLEVLNGPPMGQAENMDVADLFGGLGELPTIDELKDRVGRDPNYRPPVSAPNPAPRPARPPDPAPEPGKGRKFLGKVNRYNPAAILLRSGVLVGMKINQFKIAEKLRWVLVGAHSTARKKGFQGSPTLWNFYRTVYGKLKTNFETAGGKESNLIAAIQKGRGNRDGLAGDADRTVYTMTVRQILGEELYFEEIHVPSESLSGEPISASAALAAASALLGVVAALLRKKEKEIAAAAPRSTNREGSTNDLIPQNESDTSALDLDENVLLPIPEPEKKGIIAWARANPMVATGTGLAVGAGLYLGIRALMKSRKAKKEEAGTKGLSGPKARDKLYWEIPPMPESLRKPGRKKRPGRQPRQTSLNFKP